MSDETVVEHCSPTLAGIKTGNLFSCTFQSQSEMTADIQRFNDIFIPKGLRMLPLRYSDGRALIYLFRPERLARDLASEDAASILREAGYEGRDIQQQLRQLIHRLSDSAGFPHEIGLFLSYPPEDVRGFIELGPWKCKCTGYWKVYGDEDQAKLTFGKFRHCHDIYTKQFRAGTPLTKLTVACRTGHA